ncbi:hypothetical protein [Methylorubrum extorquens]|uniref:Phage tail lysozyme domain-containing protein n=1 Tax=Methylorubrum extorquens TaxID=408 RepID=A0AAX3WR09_METEX|nr:hypothetical protein [Methylorubrum extorquens]WHQ72524.1 hypothetical protein KEC54_13710 [Methylorubrum extorquens]
MNGATVFQMVSGLGDAFGGAYSDARKQAQEEEAPTLISNLMNAYKGGGAAAAPSVPGVGAAGAPAPSDSPSRSLPTFAQGSDIGRYAGAISGIESGGRYDAIGPTHQKYGRALGKYQVMESNLPSWSQEALGRRVSPDEFLSTPAIQDAIFAKKFGQSVEKYGNPQDAASVWFTGRPLAKGANARDSLGTTGRKYVDMFTAGLGRVPAGQAPTLPVTAMRMPLEGGAAVASAPTLALPDLPPPRRSSVAVADNEAEVQALESEMGMLPSAPRQVASAEPDDANIPAAGAQPVGFVVPQGGAPAAAPSQAFPGFPAGGGTRMTPELQTALNAAWRNPNTRAMAGEIFGQLLKGGDKSWDIKEINGQSAWVNTRDGRILPIGQAKRNTATVGNNLVDTATGEVLYSAAEKPTTVSPGSALVGPGGQVIYQAPDRESAKPVTVSAGASLVSPDGKPLFTAPDRDRTIENERKGREEAQSIRREIQGLASFKNYEQALPIYGAMVEAAPRNTKAADLNLVYGLGKIMDPGSVVREGEMVMVKNTGSLPDWLVGSINSLNGGQALTPETRNAIMTEAFGRMQAYEGALGQETARYRDIVSRAGINPEDVLPRFSTVKPYEMPKKVGSAPAPKADPSAKTAPTGPVSIPMQHVRALRANPERRAEFDQKFGAGASARILGPARDNGPDSILAGP